MHGYFFKKRMTHEIVNIIFWYDMEFWSFFNIDCHMDYQRLGSHWTNAQKIRKLKNNHTMIPQIYFLKFDFWTKTPCHPWIYVVIISYNCIFTLNLNATSHKTWWCGTRMWNIHENISRKTIWITWKSLNMK